MAVAMAVRLQLPAGQYSAKGRAAILASNNRLSSLRTGPAAVVGRAQGAAPIRSLLLPIYRVFAPFLFHNSKSQVRPFVGVIEKL
jgi:hypothetical protein